MRRARRPPRAVANVLWLARLGQAAGALTGAAGAEVCDSEPPPYSGCSRLIQTDLRNVTLGGYALDRCLGGGGTHETWLAHDAGGLKSFAIKLRKFPPPDSGNLTEEEAGMLSVPAEHMRVYVQVLCAKARLLKTHYPAHFVDCVDSGVAELELGRLVWAALELAPGRTLRSILVESPVEPPPELGTLQSVFNMSLRLFDLLDQGTRPVGPRGFRYIFSDVQWGNVFVERDGGIKVVDYDDEEVVACYSVESPPEQVLSLESALPACRLITNASLCGRHVEMARDLFINTMLMLMRVGAKSEWKDWWFNKSVDPGNGVALIPWAMLPYFYNFDMTYARCVGENMSMGRLWPPNDAAALESLTSRLRPAYAEHWSLVSFLGEELLAAASEAIRDVKWPPAFVGLLRRAHDILQNARSGVA